MKKNKFRVLCFDLYHKCYIHPAPIIIGMTQLLFTHVHSLKTLFIENKRNASAMKRLF